jgi:hypothetical protein
VESQTTGVPLEHGELASTNSTTVAANNNAPNRLPSQHRRGWGHLGHDGRDAAPGYGDLPVKCGDVRAAAHLHGLRPAAGFCHLAVLLGLERVGKHLVGRRHALGLE